MQTIGNLRIFFQDGVRHSIQLFMMSRKNIIPHDLSFYKIGKLGLQIAKLARVSRDYDRGLISKTQRDTGLEKLMSMVDRWLKMPLEEFINLSTGYVRGQIIMDNKTNS